VSAGVSLLAVFVTALDKTGRSIDKLVMTVRAFEGEPWRLVTSALPHGNALHLLFNIAWIWTLGTLLEERFGAVRLLGLMVLLAAGSEAAEYAFFRGGIGLSGVVYGLYGLLWVLSRTDKKLRGLADGRTTQIFIAWFFFCIAADVSGLMAIANVAHGVGALLGLLLGFAIAGNHRPSGRRVGVQVASVVGVLLVLSASYVGATKLRPRINFAKDGSGDLTDLADHALDQKDYDEAIRRYRQALAVSPKIARTWHNLGVAFWNAGEMFDARDAFARASELEPENQRYQDALRDANRVLTLPDERSP